MNVYGTTMLLLLLAAQQSGCLSSKSAGHNIGLLLCRDGMPSLFRLVHNNLQELVLEQCSDLYMGRRFFPSLAYLTNLKVTTHAVWLRRRPALNKRLLELDGRASHTFLHPAYMVKSVLARGKSLNTWTEPASWWQRILNAVPLSSTSFPVPTPTLLTAVPPALQVLSLKNMRSTISDADFKALASLTQLQEVVLDCDQPPDTLEDPSANEIKWGLLHFPEAMMQLTNMTHLTLSCHYGITQLPTSISRLNKLQVRALQV